MNSSSKLLQCYNKARVYWIFVFVLIAIYIIKIPMGLHPDEAFSIILMRNNTPGYFVPFAEQYTIMQTAGWIMGWIVWIYDSINGSLSGLVIFLRIVWGVVQLIFSLAIYFEFRKWWNELVAQFCSIISLVFYFNFFIPGYKSILYWSTIAVVLCLMKYERTELRGWILLAAFSYSVGAIGYLTSIILIIPILIRYIRKRDYRGVRDFIIATTIILLIAMLYSLYRSSWSDVLSVIFNSFNLGQHALNSEMTNRGLIPAAFRIARALALIAVSIIPIVLFKRLILKRDFFYLGVTLYYCCLVIVLCVLRPHSITVSRFYYADLCFWGWAWILTDGIKSSCRDMVLFIYKISLWMMLAISLGTTQGIAIIAPGSVLGIMAIVICLTDEYLINKYSISLAVMATLMFAIPFAFMVSDEDSVGNIFSKRKALDWGTVNGIYVENNLYEQWQPLLDSVKRNTNDEDTILAVGKWSQFVYLASDAQMGGYSPVVFDCSTAQEYYTKYPWRIPTKVFFHKGYYEENKDFSNWILGGYEVIEQVNDWVVYRRADE